MLGAHEPDEDPEALLEPAKSDRIVVNGQCIIYEEEEGLRVVMVAGIAVHRYHRDDRSAEDLFIVQALEVGYADTGELASALGRRIRAVQRVRERWAEGGVQALLPKKPGPNGQRLGAAEDAAIRKWHRLGLSGREMAVRLKKAPNVVQKALRRLGLPSRPPTRPDAQQSMLPGGRAKPEPDAEPEPEAPPTQIVDEPVVGLATVPAEDQKEPDRVAVNGGMTLDTDPRDRKIDRMLAQRGELLDAAPFFAPGPDVPRLGVLLALPMLVASGLFEEGERVYEDIGPAFYGLRTTLLALVLLALMRVKRAENLKEYSPPELGRLLGLDRAPEVKTMRRKVAELASGPFEELLGRLVARRVEGRSEALGFLYVDGHVRVYSGKEKLPKTHVARMRLSLPASQDVWVNDGDGQPLFFVTQQAHPSMVAALTPILDNVRRLVGERRVTIVFDRGGWSPALFKQMFEAGFDVLTYRKGDTAPVPKDAFVRYEAPGSHGRLHWDLHDIEVVVGSGFAMRQVTRRQDEHQTHIVTTRRDLDTVEVARRMFDRWRQENFFKYMRQEFAIDALVQYGAEPDDPARDVPNPVWNRADAELRKARGGLQKLEARYGAAARDNAERERPTMRGFKIAHGTELGIPMRSAQAHVQELQAARDELPQRTTVGELAEPPVRLPANRKRLTDSLRMLAYQVETDLVRLVAPHYARADDEGRKLVAAALQSAGDLQIVDGELRVTLTPQSSAHRSLAIAKLCAVLNDTDTRYPGTGLRLRYAVAGLDEPR